LWSKHYISLSAHVSPCVQEGKNPFKSLETSLPYLHPKVSIVKRPHDLIEIEVRFMEHKVQTWTREDKKLYDFPTARSFRVNTCQTLFSLTSSRRFSLTWSTVQPTFEIKLN